MKYIIKSGDILYDFSCDEIVIAHNIGVNWLFHPRLALEYEHGIVPLDYDVVADNFIKIGELL